MIFLNPIWKDTLNNRKEYHETKIELGNFLRQAELNYLKKVLLQKIEDITKVSLTSGITFLCSIE